jgi:asparagine synthase (glutamine-hydrolysing)
MCGIAGIVNLAEGMEAPSLPALRRMGAALQHRGPDEFGIYRDARAGLAHTRLAIVDLATGQQPLANEDGTVWVAFNGEIYNDGELRQELRRCGHAFRTSSDTEVIVHAYQQWGLDAFERFNGQWAVALWDSVRARLVLSRDPFGISPLYTCHARGRLFFASEVKGIFAGDRTIPRSFDPVGLEETFAFWTAVAPQTIFRDIAEIEPGQSRVFENGRSCSRRHWELRYPIAHGADGVAHEEFAGSLDEAAAAVRTTLVDAIQARLTHAAVPVAAYLSGGLDSSLLVALTAASGRAAVPTFSVRFDDREYDEGPFQRAVARAFGTEHCELTVSRRDIADSLPEAMAHIERPILRTAPVPLFILSRLARDHGIKAVVTGEGADEMFAGYDLFREATVRRFWARQPTSAIRPLLLQRLYPYLSRSPSARPAVARQFFGRHLDAAAQRGFSHDIRWRRTSALKRFLADDLRRVGDDRGRDDVVTALLDRLPDDFDRWTPLAQAQCLEIRTLLSGYLLSAQGDRVLMAHSIEGRYPFLDTRIVALANSLPSRYKLCGLDEKKVLKRVAGELLEPSIVRRKKQPYRAPDALSFAGAAAPDWVAEVLDRRAIIDAGVFEPGAVAQLWNKIRGRRATDQFSNFDNMAVVAILSTQLVHRALIARPPVDRARLRETTLVDRTSVRTPSHDSGAPCAKAI